MFVAGIEIDLRQIRSQEKQATAISITGILFPFAMGFAVVWFFHDAIFPTASVERLIPSLFFGTALSITVLSVIVKVFIDLNIQNVLHQFVMFIISPLFFASIGLRVNFITNFDLSVVAIIIGIASIAKIAGAGIGARISGLQKSESLAVALGMNARGSQEIVLDMVALQVKIIDERIFVGLVVMTVVTVLIAGPLMKFHLQKHLAENKEPAELDILITTRILEQPEVKKPVVTL